MTAAAVCMQAIRAALAAPGQGRLHIPSMPAAAGGGPLGTTALQHFLYKAPARGQYVMPAFTAPLTVPELQQVHPCVQASSLTCASAEML